MLKPLELDAMELWQVAVVMKLDETPELLQGPPARVQAPQPSPTSEVVSGPRLRSVAR